MIEFRQLPGWPPKIICSKGGKTVARIIKSLDGEWHSIGIAADLTMPEVLTIEQKKDELNRGRK